VALLRRSSLLYPLALLLALGCGRDEEPDEPLAIPEGCNPIAADWDCLLPYPSDTFLVEGRVEIPPPAQLVYNDGTQFDLVSLHPADGFPFGTQIVAFFPEGVRADELLPYYEDPLRSLDPGSTTLLVDAETGERVPHFSELDATAAEQPERQALLIRPLVRLQASRRYVVGIRGLRDPAGTPLAPPEAFRRLRDQETHADPILAELAARYEQGIFPKLEAAGAPRTELLLAWDFTVRSEENATADMLAIRADTLQRLAANPPVIKIVEAKADPSSRVALRIEASVEVPLYVESTELGAPLARDQAGNVVANGTAEVPFTVWIPKSVAAGSTPARLMQYGHGFFGARSEVDSYPADLADERGFVVIATDWWGMSAPDRDRVGDNLLNDPARTVIFSDRVHQAMVNQIYVAGAAQGPLAALPELQLPFGPAYDPGTVYFYGNSMGHILGGVYLALAPAIERAVLGVGGANWSLMASRAEPFGPFLFLISVKLPDFLDRQKLVTMLQSSMERIDPLTYAPRALAETYPNSPPARRVLVHIGVGDAAVPNLAAHLHARALGIPLLEPGPRTLAGIEPKPAPMDSALVEFDFGINPWPDAEARPPPLDPSNKVHESVRRLPAAKEQIDRFFRPGGKIESICEGPCDPD
jgi:hypothetical protein